MFRREDAWWEELPISEDYAMWLRLAAAGRRFYNVPEVLVRHRIHRASAFNTRVSDDESLRRRWRTP